MKCTPRGRRIVEANLRDYQLDIVKFIQRNERCAVFGGMGVGKSLSTLTALEELTLAEDVYPALIVAPLRVAQSTWPEEVLKWDHLKHLRVSVIVGSKAERCAALQGLIGGNCSTVQPPADIYCVNYDVIAWLVEHLGDNWPFKTIVADESTKLKGFRTRQGTARAKALASRAHQSRRFIELTGTPAANGLKDIWGQAHFLDKGDRLGRSFTAFSNRWFRSGYDGFSIEPLPHAQAEIQNAMRDICITVSAADYMDLPELIESNVYVDLPPKARAIYRDMEREMFAEINEVGVEAFNAAVRTSKCLQLASGAIYTDEAGSWEEVHDLKLDALEDIIEEAAGMPVLVSYQFKSDLARILKRFKKARHLDKDTKTIRDWNAGKIEILACHPASAGHGLNLQHGSNIICYFSSGWNLEEDMQILERIGPTRQKQAGLDREVYSRRIVARDTVDEMVAERRQSKKTVQEILLNAMKRKQA